MAATIGAVIEELVFGYVPAMMSYMALIAARIAWSILHYFNLGGKPGVIYAIIAALDGFTVYIPLYILLGPFHGFIAALIVHAVVNVIAARRLVRRCSETETRGAQQQHPQNG